MIDRRPGEGLWMEWPGEGYESNRLSSLVFYTEEHVDVNHDVVKKALASALQRDGSVDSLGDAYRSIERGQITLAYAGSVGGELYLTICDDTGETNYGDQVDQIIPITLVEV